MKLNTKEFSGDGYRITWKVDSNSVRVNRMLNDDNGGFYLKDMVGDYYGTGFDHVDYESCLRSVLTRASEKWNLQLLKPEMQLT